MFVSREAAVVGDKRAVIAVIFRMLHAVLDRNIMGVAEIGHGLGVITALVELFDYRIRKLKARTGVRGIGAKRFTELHFGAWPVRDAPLAIGDFIPLAVAEDVDA